MINKFSLGMIAFAMTFLSGCGYSDYTPTLKIGGTVSGLPKSVDVVLMNNGDRVNTIYAENGEFTFKTQVAYGASYKVEILTQPGAFKWCYVANGSGQKVTADVTNISVACEDAKVEVTNILSPGVSTDISGLAVSPSGEVFVSQETGRNISKVEALNTLTPYATNLLNPHDIAFDETGNIYYLGNTDESIIYTLDKNKAETRFGVIRPGLRWDYILNGVRGLQIDRTTGKFYLTSGTQGLVGSYDPKTKEEKAYEITIYTHQDGEVILYNNRDYLSLSSSVATDKLGNIYTADLNFIGVSKIDKTGVSHNYAGFFQQAQLGQVRNGTGSEATFASPQGITSDRSGYVYVVDPGTMVIRQIAPSDADPNVGVVTTLKTNGVNISLGQWRYAPPDIATMRITTGFDGALYTLDQTTGEIKRIRAVAPR